MYSIMVSRIYDPDFRIYIFLFPYHVRLDFQTTCYIEISSINRSAYFLSLLCPIHDKNIDF